MVRAALLVASVVVVAACAPNGDPPLDSTVGSTSSVATTMASEVDGASTTAASSTSTLAVVETAAPLPTVPAVTVATVAPAPPAPTLATVPPVGVVTVPVTAASTQTTTTTGATTTTVGTAATTTTAATRVTTTIAEGDVSSLLLDDDDLSTDWEVSEPEPYVGTRDTDIAEACPSADALNRVDLRLTWRSDYATEDVLSLQQMVGTYPTAADAVADVAEIARIGSCDLSSFFTDAETTAEALDTDVDAPGSDAASVFLVDSTPNGAYVEVIAVAVGPIVTLIIVTGTSEVPVVDDFVTSAAEKIVTLTS